MEVLYILLPATLLVASLFVGLFIFSVSRGQFEEVESSGSRAIFEDKKHESEGKENGPK